MKLSFEQKVNREEIQLLLKLESFCVTLLSCNFTQSLSSIFSAQLHK